MTGADLLLFAPALAMALLIAISHALLGMEVLRRGIVFMDLAVAQVAALGLLLANLMGHSHGPAAQAAGLALALGLSLLLRWLEPRLRPHMEPFIGSCYVLAAAVMTLVITGHPEGNEILRRWLSGDLLFIRWQQVATHLPVYLLFFALWLWKPARLDRSLIFYLAFALVVTSSVQLVGLYLVFASLVMPVLSGRLWASARTGGANPRHAAAWALGQALVVTLLGVPLSLVLDLPTAALLVSLNGSLTLALALWAGLQSGRSSS